MLDEQYILSYEGECESSERQSLLFGHDRGFEIISPEPGTRILDAGCGSGWLSRLIAQRMPSREVVGVDINPDYLEFAQNKVDEAGLENVSHKVANLSELPFESADFDTVWSLMVLMLLPNRQDALTELSRVTKSNGRVIAA